MMKISWFILIIMALLVYGNGMDQTTLDRSNFPPKILPLATPIVRVTNGKEATPPVETPLVDDEKDIFEEGNTTGELDNIPAPSEPPERTPGIALFDFDGREPAWYTVNDNVMGGISTSSVTLDKEQQNLKFSGNVSLENNGGFASIRSQWAPYDLESFDGLLLRVRGDGNMYRIRIRTEDTGTAIAYTGLFKTEANTWQEIFIPFAEMVPLYRGFVVDAAGPLNPATIRSFGLMMSDKQQGEFSLEVDWINAVALESNEYDYVQNAVDNNA